MMIACNCSICSRKYHLKEKENCYANVSSSNCDEYNIIGFDCELDIYSLKRDRRVAKINLAAYDGTCVFIELSMELPISSNKLKVKLLYYSDSSVSNDDKFVGLLKVIRLV